MLLLGTGAHLSLMWQEFWANPWLTAIALIIYLAGVPILTFLMLKKSGIEKNGNNSSFGFCSFGMDPRMDSLLLLDLFGNPP